MPAKKSNGSYNGSQKDILLLSSEEFVNTYTYLVQQVAKGIHRHLPRHVIDLSSLMQSGFVGLLEARQRYNTDYGVAFAYYARYRIYGEIMDYLRTLDIVSRSALKKGRDLKATRQLLENKLGRDVSAEEMAAELGITIENYFTDESMANTHVVAFEDFVDEVKLIVKNMDVVSEAVEYIPSGLFANPATIFEKEELTSKLEAAIKKLPEILRQIVTLYYFEEMTFCEIGKIFGITEGRACQQLTLARKFLRYILSENSGEDLSQTQPLPSEHIEDNIEDIEEALSLLLS